jgi:hypothetical protein
MSDSTNTSRLKQMAIRGKEYSEIREYDYISGDMELSLSPLIDEVLLPIVAVLEEKFGIEDVEEASEEIDEARGEDGDIDPAEVDEDFVALMGKVCVEGINTDEADGEGASEEELRQVVGISDDEDENVGLIGGFTLEIAQDILDLSSDADTAENFRR